MGWCVSTLGSAASGVANAVGQCLSKSSGIHNANTANPVFNNNFDPKVDIEAGNAYASSTNTINVQQQGWGMLTVGGLITTFIGGIGIGVGASTPAFYNSYKSRDDNRLIEQLKLPGCGSLSEMLPKIEGCYRDYVSAAIHRQSSNYNLYKDLDERFHACFDNRKNYKCTLSGWWNFNDLYKKVEP